MDLVEARERREKPRGEFRRGWIIDSRLESMLGGSAKLGVSRGCINKKGSRTIDPVLGYETWGAHWLAEAAPRCVPSLFSLLSICEQSPQHCPAFLPRPRISNRFSPPMYLC